MPVLHFTSWHVEDFGFFYSRTVLQNRRVSELKIAWTVGTVGIAGPAPFSNVRLSIRISTRFSGDVLCSNRRRRGDERCRGSEARNWNGWKQHSALSALGRLFFEHDNGLPYGSVLRMAEQGHRRIERLLTLLNCLQSGHAVNMAALERICRVSRRTIFRDLRVLRDAGVDIQFNERQRGYCVSKRLNLMQLDLSKDELLAVCLLCHIVAQEHVAVPDSLRSQAESAASKMASLLSETDHNRLLRRSRAIAVELDPPESCSATLSHFDSLLEAIETRRSARINYFERRAGSLASTLVSPYRLVLHDEAWYVVGRSSWHRSVQTFHLSSIESIELTQQTFDVPPRLNLRRYFQDGQVQR